MNSKSVIKVFQIEKIIEINSAFEKACQNPLSDEYEILQNVRRDHPKFTIKARKIKKNPNKETYPGLTYEYMRDYIILHSTPEEEREAVAEFDDIIHTSKCQSKSRRYPIVKNWFLAKYPEVKEFGLATIAAAEQKRREADLGKVS